MLIVGLGNPGANYARTRHNAGAIVLDELARRLGGTWSTAGEMAVCEAGGHVLVKPLVPMNLSGGPVHKAMKRFGVPLASVLVVHDDTDTDFGKVRPKAGGSAGGHNGVLDIIDECGGDGFGRIRVGVGRGGDVLDPFSAEELATLGTVLDKAVRSVLDFAEHGYRLPPGQRPPRAQRGRRPGR